MVNCNPIAAVQTFIPNFSFSNSSHFFANDRSNSIHPNCSNYEHHSSLRNIELSKSTYQIPDMPHISRTVNSQSVSSDNILGHYDTACYKNESLGREPASQ